MRRNFRLRTLLLAVAVVGVTIGGWINATAERRRADLRRRVESFAYGEAEVIEQIADKLRLAREAEGRGPAGDREAMRLRGEAERLALLAAWHVRMERKYARAADHPWESLVPDDPPP